MGPIVSKQDIQTMINTLQTRVFERAASKQDFQTINDILKSLVNINQQNQQVLRQSEYQRSQLVRRMMAMETRLVQLEQEVHSYKELLSRIETDHMQKRQVVFGPGNMTSQMAAQQAAQYVYRAV